MWGWREDFTKDVKDRNQCLKILNLNFKNVPIRVEKCVNQSRISIYLRQGNDKSEVLGKHKLLLVIAQKQVKQCDIMFMVDCNLFSPFPANEPLHWLLCPKPNIYSWNIRSLGRKMMGFENSRNELESWFLHSLGFLALIWVHKFEIQFL